MNNIFLSGNLAKDPQTLTYSGDKLILSFTIAHNSKYRNSRDVLISDVFYMDCVYFKQAQIEYLKDKLVKGSKVTISGVLKASEYTVDGVKKKAFQIVCDSINFG